MRQTTDAQLVEYAQPPEQQALEALRRRDFVTLDRLLEEMAAGHAGLDALTLHAIARKAGKLRADHGEEKALRLLQRIGARMTESWVQQLRDGDRRGAIADLVAVLRNQSGAGLAPLVEDAQGVTLHLAPCGSGGRVDLQKLPTRHPQAYGNWSDGANSFCQACQACQHSLNEAVGEEFWTTRRGTSGECTVRFAKRAGEGARLFDETARTQLVQTRVQQARARLAAGDEDIAGLLDGQRKDWRPWHDFAVVMLAYFYATALELGGQDYLDEMLAQTYAPAFVAGFPRYAAMSDEERVREIARTWNYHVADFHIEEQDDRYVFVLDPCGSGGRLLRGEMWRDLYAYGRELSPTVPTEHRVNFMRRDAPVYCTHCASSNRAQLSRALDPTVPLFFVADGQAQQRAGDACRLYVYKQNADRRRIDPALLAQVQISTPSSLSSDTLRSSPPA